MAHQEIILGIIATIAFLGNMLTVLLFLRKSTWLKKTYNCLILALAIQDILLAICLVALPGFILEYDYYTVPVENEISRLVFCKILWSQFIPFALGIASVYSCLMLTFDRWLAVVRPLSYKKYEQSKIVIILTVLFPWIAGMCFEITSPVNTAWARVNGTFQCYWKTPEYTAKTFSVAVFTFLGMIVVPASLMVLAYHRIVIHIKRSRNRVGVIRNSNEWNRQRKAFASLKRVTTTAFLASTVVIVCWLPDQLYYALSQVGLTELGTTFHLVVKILAFANSCFNPMIYCFSNNMYRRGLREMFGCLCCKVYPLASQLSAAEPNTCPNNG
jgi:hypothetical protein